MRLPLQLASDTTKASIAAQLPEPVFNSSAFLQNDNPSFIVPQCSCGGGVKKACSCNGGKSDDYVYVFGEIRPVLPSLSIEKEFYNTAVTDPADRVKPFDSIAFKYLSKAENLYLAREMNWVFRVKGYIDLYIIRVTTNNSLTSLIETIATRTQIDHDIIIASMSNYVERENTTGDELPVITYSKVYNITNEEFIKAISKAIEHEIGSVPVPENVTTIYTQILQLTQNMGDEDKYRGLNFIVLRYLKFYVETYKLAYIGIGAGAQNQKFDLTAVHSNPVEIHGRKSILQIVFSYQGQESSATKTFTCSLDVAGEFPYLTIPWVNYYKGI